MNSLDTKFSPHIFSLLLDSTDIKLLCKMTIEIAKLLHSVSVLASTWTDGT